MQSLFGRIGGKSRLKKTIVDDYFPKDYEQMTYVEPFVGGGSIFFYKNPSIREVINDIDEGVISVYKGFKKYNGEKISNDVNHTYTKEEFIHIRDMQPKNEYQSFLKNFILFRISILSQQKSYSNKSKISTNFDNSYKERLKNTVILSTDYKNVIKKYDSPNTFFYLDPPYENSNSSLYKDFDIDYNELFNILNHIQGRFLLSLNTSPTILQLFKKFNIYNVKTNYTINQVNYNDDIRHVTEILICNY